MKDYLFSLVFFGLLQSVTAQQLYPLESKSDSIQFSVGSIDQRIAMTLKEPVSRLNKGKSIVDIRQIYLSDADLVILYTPARQQRGFTHQLEFHLKDRSGNTIVPDKYSIKKVVAQNGAHRLVWMDATETPLVFGQEYVLYIQVSVLGPVDCNADRPAFTLKQQLPYYAVGIAGLSAIGVGYGLNAQKKNAYRQYADKWANGDTESAAQNDLRSAQDKKRQAEIMIYSGLAILTIDALLWSMRNVKTKREQRRFDRYCIQPARIGFTPVQGNNKLQHLVSPGYGLQLTYGF